MAAVELRVDLSALLDAARSGNQERTTSIMRMLLEQEKNADVLIGRIGVASLKGDTDGWVGLTSAASAMLARMIRVRPAPLDQEVPPQIRAYPLFARVVQLATPALRAAQKVSDSDLKPLFPSALLDSGKSVNQVTNEAVARGNASQIERILLGLYGTGADYRTLLVRIYESLATSFQQDGHDLINAVHASQLLDSVEWARNVPPVLHWLAPKIAAKAGVQQMPWIEEVRRFSAEQSMASIRTRLTAPKDANALALHQLLLSNATTAQILQGVYDAVMRGEASPHSVGSVISLAAAELLQKVDENQRDLFIRVGNGLLYASATRTALRQVQDVEILPALYTAAAYVNALHKQVATQAQAQPIVPKSSIASGGMIAVSQLERIEEELKQKDAAGALATAQRYLHLGHDARALFGTIGLGAALNDAQADQGRSLQIVQAAGEEFVDWPKSLASTQIEAFLQVALRAAAFGKRDTLLS